LKVTETLDLLKKKISEKYLEQIINDEFLNNLNKVIVAAEPKESFHQEINKKE